MGLTSLQVCMDSSDWLQGTINEESAMDSSSLSGDMLSCSRPLTERRLRPPHDQALKCPRCDSTHTKFCYYNNYSLSQPRYFCKTCRRYWTKGGTLRNIPVGGGCRKNKKVTPTKKGNEQSPITTSNLHHHHHGSSSQNPTDLHLSFPDQVQFPHFNTLISPHGNLGNPSFMETRYGIGMLENPRPIDFMESKMEGINGRSFGHGQYSGSADQLMVSGLGADHLTGQNFHGFCSNYALSLDGNGAGNSFMDSCQRLMNNPYDHEPNQDPNSLDVKPNTKLLALEWQDQGCSEKVDSYGYINGMGSSWNGMMNGYGPNTTNSLV